MTTWIDTETRIMNYDWKPVREYNLDWHIFYPIWHPRLSWVLMPTDQLRTACWSPWNVTACNCRKKCLDNWRCDTGCNFGGGGTKDSLYWGNGSIVDSPIWNKRTRLTKAIFLEAALDHRLCSHHQISTQTHQDHAVLIQHSQYCRTWK